MNSNGTTYQNGRFVNVDEVHNNTKNMTLSGFNQEGGTVTGNIENLIIESKQNTSTTKGSTKGGSLSISANGLPSGSANYSKTNGERRVVDNASTFIIGDGSNLKVAKVENTASAIGTTGNGKLSIDEYVGHDLENVDKLKTAGGSVGVSTSGVNNIGVNYSDKKQEGITKNTVIGNVEIGKSSGDEINRDLDTMTEITEDRDFKTNVNIESQTIKYALNPNQFKEDLQIAIIEGKATGRTVVKTIDNVINGDKSQDIGDAERRSLIEIKEAIVRVQTAPAMDIIAEGKLERKEVQEELGVVIEKFDPNDPTLSEKVRERIDELKAEGKEIVAFYDKVTKKIFINQNAKDEEVRASIAREYKIKEDLELGRGKANDKGQLRSTVAGEIAYDEIKDRLKKGDKNPISASSFDVAKMDKDSEVTSDLRDKNVQREFFNSLPYIATTSNGARKINPKVLKEMQGDKGELEDFIFRADFYIKSIDLLYAESEEGKKKIAIVNPIVDSLNKNSPDREYYKIIDGRKKEVLIASNPKPKSYLHHLLKSLDEFGNAPLHFLEAGDKFFNSDIKGAVNEGSAALDSFFKPATLGFGSKLGDEAGRVGKGSDQYGSKEEVEWKQKFIGSNIESVADMVAIYLTGKFVGTGVKLLDKKINYSNLTYDEYKFLKEYKNKPISGKITSKYKDIKTGRYVTPTGDNIKEARKYLTDMGLESKEIDRVLDSFAPQTLKVVKAGSEDYGIRFYDMKYKANPGLPKPGGQYLFETFTPNINREGLALPPSWNQMTGIKQWQIKPETVILKGIADSQKLDGAHYIYPGGAKQIFIYQPWKYKTLLEP